jgi:hypothetical protein
MYIAGRLNLLQSQASVALDTGASPEHRRYAASELCDTLARLPALSLISHVLSLAAPPYWLSRADAGDLAVSWPGRRSARPQDPARAAGRWPRASG